jgi:hypothetical protein
MILLAGAGYVYFLAETFWPVKVVDDRFHVMSTDKPAYRPGEIVWVKHEFTKYKPYPATITWQLKKNSVTWTFASSDTNLAAGEISADSPVVLPKRMECGEYTPALIVKYYVNRWGRTETYKAYANKILVVQ